MTDIPQPIHVLTVGDLDFAVEALKTHGLAPAWKSATSREQVIAALDERFWDLVLSDYEWPGLDARDALAIVRERDTIVPFILVCGTIGEEASADMMRAGANDIVLRDRLSRLAPAVERELHSATLRRERMNRPDSGQRASEARFQSYFELALVGMVTTAPDGTFLEVNQRFCEMLGYSRAELSGRTLAAVTHPEDLAGEVADPEAADPAESDRHSEHRRFLRKDGDVIHALVSSAAIRRPDRSIDQVLSIVEDITPQKLAEQELLRREHLFRAVVENTPDLIARFGRDLRRRYVNPAIERLTGRPISELIGKTMAELNFDPRFSGRIEQAISAVFATGTETTLEVHLPSPAGERVFQAKIVPEVGATGEVDFALVISRDITDIRRDQERLHALTREVELLLASTYEGIWAADLSDRCTLVNASASSMLGYPAGEMMGQSIHELVHPKQAGASCTTEDCSLLRATQESKAAQINSVLRRKNGTSFSVEIFISPILGDDKTLRGSVVSFIDTTERQQLQMELERANRLVGLGRVASAMSHEFNNVLMGIQPFAEILLRSIKEPRALDAANRIIQSVNRGRGITEDLRAFTRPAAPVRRPVDVRAWLSDCSGDLGRLLPPSIRFDVEIADAPMTIDADRNQIMQVLSNIIVNAREAIGGDRGTIRLMATLARNPARLLSDEPFVHLTVTDDGPGIDPHNQTRIFEPFFTTKKGGKGLGLAVAHQIATLHGGHLFLASEAGAGTSVQLVLPQSTREAAVDQRRIPPVRRHLPAEILLVEDDEAVASGVVSLLEDEKVSVRLAGDGAVAMKILESYTPQALVIDINLPDCNGFDLYEQITASFGPFPVVFASGHADSSRLEKLSPAAGRHLLTKPYAIDALLDILDTLVPSGA